MEQGDKQKEERYEREKDEGGQRFVRCYVTDGTPMPSLLFFSEFYAPQNEATLA
jgi:hypothetical protein